MVTSVHVLILLTRVLVHNLPGVVEVRVPVVPLPSGEPQLPARDSHVGGRPVAAVCAHRPPKVALKHLDDALVDAGSVHQPDRTVGGARVNLLIGRDESARNKQ